MSIPTTTPRAPPMPERVIASLRNCMTMSRLTARLLALVAACARSTTRFLNRLPSNLDHGTNNLDVEVRNLDHVINNLDVEVRNPRSPHQQPRCRGSQP